MNYEYELQRTKLKLYKETIGINGIFIIFIIMVFYMLLVNLVIYLAQPS